MGLIRIIRRYLDGKVNYHGAKEVGDSVVSFVFDTSDLLLDLHTLQVATNFFSQSNLLRRGGFSNVYKGLMPNGQEIAVKRLFNTAIGVREFTNEAELLSGIRHMNLVTLLGCCVQGPEKMLVYEYLPNRSLDYFLFDKEKSSSLDWATRFCIVTGVARGLLYLHEEAPMRMLHRQIKARNILLDEKLSPKISDFGYARLFPEEDTHVPSYPIVGSIGYMAPEILRHGYFVKTDIFSYGILLLEIISGRRHAPENACGLTPDYVNLWHLTWKLYQAGKTLQLVDPSLGNSYNADEVVMCIQIGLWCCQESAADRPDMNSIHAMLCSDAFNSSLVKVGNSIILEYHSQNSLSASSMDEGR